MGGKRGVCREEGDLQTSLVELWLKELTDKIKYALYVADSVGRSDLGHNSNLAQSRTEADGGGRRRMQASGSA